MVLLTDQVQTQMLFDEFEVTISTKLFGSDLSVGYADDVNSDISYWGVAGSTDLESKHEFIIYNL